jgi:hypothetical protein
MNYVVFIAVVVWPVLIASAMGVSTPRGRPLPLDPVGHRIYVATHLGSMARRTREGKRGLGRHEQMVPGQVDGAGASGQGRCRKGGSDTGGKGDDVCGSGDRAKGRGPGTYGNERWAQTFIQVRVYTGGKISADVFVGPIQRNALVSIQCGCPNKMVILFPLQRTGIYLVRKT